MNSVHFDTPTDASAEMSRTRIMALSDGVFAIAVTLLVFNIRLPDIPADAVDRDLARALLSLWPAIVSYVLSVIVIGTYWVAHHNIFHLIRRTDRPLLWINLFYLMCVAFIPLPASILGRYGAHRAAVHFYGFSLILTGMALECLWQYASRQRLVEASMLQHSRLITFKIMIVPMLCLCSIGLSYINARASIGLYVIAPLFYIFPNKLDKTWQSKQQPS